MAVAITLHNEFKNEFLVDVYDKNEFHFKLTHLHRTTTEHPSKYRVKIEKLARNFHFTFKQSNVNFEENFSALFDAEKANIVSTLEVNNSEYEAIVLATGGAGIDPGITPDNFVTLEKMKQPDFWLREYLQFLPAQAAVSIIGGGATGIQLACEIAEFAEKEAHEIQVTMFEAGNRILPAYPEQISAYATTKLQQKQVQLLTNSRFVIFQDNTVSYTTPIGTTIALPSHLVLFVPGVRANPHMFKTNEYGWLADISHLPVFACGDNSEFAGKGLNAKSAQAALRKGRCVARNVAAHFGKGKMAAYDYNELGYFISLGKADAVGWLFFKNNVVTGLPASFMKEAIETQYDLFLAGINTFPEFRLPSLF